MCAFDHCFRGNAVDAILTPLRRAKKWTPNITLPFGVALYLLRRQTQTKHTSLTRNTALVVIEKGLLFDFGFRLHYSTLSIQERRRLASLVRHPLRGSGGRRHHGGSSGRTGRTRR